MTIIGTTLAGVALAFGLGLSQPTTFEKTTTLVFATPLRDFIKEADNPGHDGQLVWDSDKCSAPVLGSAGKTYDFSDPCRRHDFAYRNFGRIDGGRKWTKALRERVDRQFLADMNASCSKRSWFVRPVCRAWAKVYYLGVRTFGSSYATVNPSA